MLFILVNKMRRGGTFLLVNCLDVVCDSLPHLSDRLDFHVDFHLALTDIVSKVDFFGRQGNDRSGLTPSTVCITRRSADSRHNFLKLCRCHSLWCRRAVRVDRNEADKSR